MAKTGPHSFTDATGVEWHITGYSKVCGPMYVDCRSEDGVALTVRPVAYLESAGLTLPAGAEPPVRKATAAERKKAERETAQLEILAPPVEEGETQAVGTTEAKPSPPPEPPPVEGVTEATTDASGGKPAHVGAPSTDGEHERGCGCAACATMRNPQGTLWPPQHVYPENAEEALTKTAPSLKVPEQEAEGTPQATGAGGADKFGGTIAEEHERYGCLLCGDVSGLCTPTECMTERVEREREAFADGHCYHHAEVSEHPKYASDDPPGHYRCEDCGSEFPLIGDTFQWLPSDWNGAEWVPRTATESLALIDPSMAGLVEIAPGEWAFPEHE